MKINFWGAAQQVTGSMHEIQVGDQRILLDCGLVQGKRREAFDQNAHLPFSPSEIDAIVLSHAHLDHSGNLPTLYKQGFRGAIHTTRASMELCSFMLADSAHLQEHNSQYIERRRARWQQIQMNGSTSAVPPLYSMSEVHGVLSHFVPIRYAQEREIAPGVTTALGVAGHLLGSAFVNLVLDEDGRKVRVVFSGDLGRPGLPIIKDPDPAPQADYLVLESTYGDRVHPTESTAKEKLCNCITRTVARGGRVIIPAFAVGRTQQIVLLLHQLVLEGRLQDIPIFADSPLAINITEIYRNHPEEFDTEMQRLIVDEKDPFGFRRLRYLQSSAESKSLNDLRKPFIVISSSGMCEGGRILHHLKNGIEDPRNLVLLAGFQAQNTLGRSIAEKRSIVTILGEQYTLRAEVEMFDELSGHGDQKDLVEWVRPVARGLKKIFLVHGEKKAQVALADLLRASLGVSVIIPERGQKFDLTNS